MPRRAALTLIAPLLLATVACTAPGPTAAGARSATAAADPAPPTGGPSAGSPTPATAETGQRCHPGEVRVTLQAAPGGGAAGSVYSWLIFTNDSARSCTLYGYPGVSWVTGPSGQTVNQPARRNATGSPARVTLAPGERGHAQLRTGHPEAFPDTCRPVPVAGYRVYLPDETAAVFVAAPMQQCSADGVNVASVEPIVGGLNP